LVLRFADELRGTSDLDLPAENLKTLGITSKELEMAEKLVGGMVDEWHPEKYRDDYRKDLLSLIHSRAKAGEVNTLSKEKKKAPRAAKPGKVVDLVALLAQSMESGHHKKKPAHAKPSAASRAKATPHKRPAAKRREHPTSHARKSA